MGGDCAFEIHNSRLSKHNPEYTEYLYGPATKRAYLERDAQRLVNQDRNVFAACMLAHGHADGMVTGVTRHYDVALNTCAPGDRPAPRRTHDRPVHSILTANRTLFVADTNVIRTAEAHRNLRISPCRLRMRCDASITTRRVAFVSYSNFGNPDTEHSRRVAGAVQILDQRQDVDFEYEGEMTPRMALNEQIRSVFPFSRLQGEANVLITPGVHSAGISTKLVGELGGAIVIGPVLIGLERPVQIAQVGARVGDVVTLAAVAAYELDKEHRSWAEKAV